MAGGKSPKIPFNELNDSVFIVRKSKYCFIELRHVVALVLRIVDKPSRVKGRSPIMDYCALGTHGPIPIPLESIRK